MKAGILTMMLVGALAAVQTASAGIVTSTYTVTRAVAVLSPTAANSVSGTVTFTRVQTGVRIVADLTGLTPGAHGFHIHEFGDCTAPDATSAGGHFNPARAQHGPPDTVHRHAGDFGNLIADATGRAHYERVDTMITMEGLNSIIGRAVIVHEKTDDLRTQPTGNAGARVACGVIGVASP
jgi:superoxide dismutase, Cu-Zn family